MLKRILILLFLVFIMLPLLAVGPESGGGGGVVYLHREFHLVDYFNIPEAQKILQNRYRSTRPSIVAREFADSFVSKAQISDPAIIAAVDILSQWSNLPYDLMGFAISRALYQPVKWSFTDLELQAPHSYRPSQLLSGAQVLTAAYYEKVQQEYKIKISRKIWNQLNIQDQIGLIVHEILRHIQLSRQVHFSDEALQKATALLLICKPSIARSQYLWRLLVDTANATENLNSKFLQQTDQCWVN